MRILIVFVVLVLGARPSFAQTVGSFDKAAAQIRRQLEQKLAELAALQKRISEEKLPLDARLAELEARLGEARAEHQKRVRSLDKSNLDVSNLVITNKRKRDQSDYLSTNLGTYVREFETRLQIAERQRYEKPLRAAVLAAENSSLSARDVFEAQLELLRTSMDRLEDVIGGTRFKGTAVDSKGLVEDGEFVVVGPAAIFRSADGEVGSAQQRLGGVIMPTSVAFGSPEDAVAASGMIEASSGEFPLDPSLGNASKIEATQETFWQHVQKGGPVMVPIFVLAGLAFILALYKWISMAFLRKPSRRQVTGLLDAVGAGDREAVEAAARTMPGPVGAMLRVGTKHLGDPRDLVEEVMYENVLTTRLRLQRLLPFIAICAAAAPLLGLLGTVTGIINTFKLITVFGSGDVKMLSGGISEALITTKFGLIVAIPSLLLHAYLARKARGVIGNMETAAVAFVNKIGTSRIARPSVSEPHAPAPGADPELVRAQVGEILTEMLGPLVDREEPERAGAAATGGLR